MKRKNNLKELKRNHKIHEYFIPKSVVNDLSEDSVQESIVILDNSPEISQLNFYPSELQSKETSCMKVNQTMNLNEKNLNMFHDFQLSLQSKKKTSEISKYSDFSESSELSSPTSKEHESDLFIDSDLSYNGGKPNSVIGCDIDGYSFSQQNDQFCIKSMFNFSKDFSDEESKSIYRLTKMHQRKDTSYLKKAENVNPRV